MEVRVREESWKGLGEEGARPREHILAQESTRGKTWSTNAAVSSPAFMVGSEVEDEAVNDSQGSRAWKASPLC